MGRQSEIFRNGEAKEWLSRNQHKLPLENDPVVAALRNQKIYYQSVLEVGCANGWRLYEIQDTDTSPDRSIAACGIDPCIDNPIVDGNLQMVRGTAESIPFHDNSFDLVIYGFCLYLCDPEDYFKIAMEGDRVLISGGHICIYDFHTDEPYANPYEHKFGVFSHKMDFSSLWSWSPCYKIVSHVRMGKGDDRTTVSILQKLIAPSFSVRK